MFISSNYETVDIAGEILVVPVGDHAAVNKVVYSFTNAAGFLIKKMKNPLTVDEMVDSLTSEFIVDTDTAQKDVQRFIEELLSLGLIEN